MSLVIVLELPCESSQGKTTASRSADSMYRHGLLPPPLLVVGSGQVMLGIQGTVLFFHFNPGSGRLLQYAWALSSSRIGLFRSPGVTQKNPQAVVVAPSSRRYFGPRG